VPWARSWWFPMRPDELQRLIDTSPVHRGLRLRVTSADDKLLRLASETGPEHVGEDGSDYLHGGVIATLLDTTATFALIQATGVDWGTVDLRIDYVRPAPAGPLLANASATHVGRRLGRASAELTDPATGRLLASAVGTFVRTAPSSE
jgi:uncharacterized protein (TIGR00369 family)